MILQTLVKGIKSVAKDAYEAVKDSLGWVGKLLPGSDAKEGPLSRLTRSGRALLGAFGQGVRQAAPALAKTTRTALAGTTAAMAMATAQPALSAGTNVQQPATFLQQAQAEVQPILNGLPRIPDQQAYARITPYMDQTPEIGNLAAQAKIVSLLESIPNIPDQQAYARITPYMDRVPAIQDQSAQARIIPFLDSIPQIPSRFEQDRIAPISQHQASREPQQVTLHMHQTFNIQGSGDSTEDNVREAGREAGKSVRQAIEDYFAEEARVRF